MQTAAPASLCQALPRRPRPAVCRFASTSVPDGASSAASAFAARFVEGVSSKTIMRRAREFPASFSANAAGSILVIILSYAS